MATKNTCNGCTECCVAFPLLPQQGWWPEGKPAHTPCRFLACDGCSIHDHARPSVCIDYECGWITHGLPASFRPKESKVIISYCTLKSVFQRATFGAQSDTYLDMDDPVCTFTETAQRALVKLDAHKLRWHLGKNLTMPRWVGVVPYGIDNLTKGSTTNADHIRLYPDADLLVLFREEGYYAAEVYMWWKNSL
jgi:hypothetical protein